MSEERKTYKIGEKKYIQGRLLYAQLRQILNAVKGIQFPSPITFSSAVTEIMNNEDVALKIAAILLTPEGTRPQDKDVEAVMKDLEWSLDVFVTGREIVEHFFELNRGSLLLNDLAPVIEKVVNKAAQMFLLAMTQLNTQSVSSQTETPQSEIKSSGSAPSTLE